MTVTSICGLGLLLILGFVFSLARGSEELSARADQLHNADENLRAATVVRAQVGLATHMLIVDEAFGTNSAAALGLSLSEARSGLQDMERSIAELDESDSSDVAAAVRSSRDFASISREALVAITDGDVQRARSISSRHDEAFQAVRSELETIRGRLAASVASSNEFLGRIRTVAGFLAAFLVPAAVIFIYRGLVVRHKRQAELESRLESERRLNSAREEFIANASHELRTPLTGISGLAQILADDPAIAESENASELLHLIIAESHDLTRMVEDLLTTARLDAGALHFDFDDVAIEEVIGEVVEPLVYAGVEIFVDCEPATIRADGLRTRQVLRNLISNARKYGRSRIEVSGRIDGTAYVCDVIDDGHGVPDQLADRMFERFVHRGGRTAVSDSVGLGLAIVHALVQGMGGSVEYLRTGNRTVFRTRLPLSGQVEPPGPVPAPGPEDLELPKPLIYAED
ncbi:MAG: histidine kinase dimerization/phospho-acceptor domain-containing protein [Gammaproteobacteria bacterium]